MSLFQMTLRLGIKKLTFMRNLSNFREDNRTFHKCSSIFARNLHFSRTNFVKSFTDRENHFAFNVLPKIHLNQATYDDLEGKILTEGDFNELLKRNWRTSNISDIVKAFLSVENYCIIHNINVSDLRFDNLVNGLMDNCEHLKDDDLLRLLWSLSKYPPCEAITSHNFHDIWSCLDDICCWKMNKWNFDQLFQFGDAWFRLNLGRMSDFVYEVLNKLPSRAKKFSKNDFVRLFFLINICRNFKVAFEYEYNLERVVHQMNLDELAIIAMGFFKSQTKIKLRNILKVMIERVRENCETAHEISLTAILKIIRLSKPTDLASEIYGMLDDLTPQINRLSNVSCLHLALIGTNLQLKHEASLVKTSAKIQTQIADVEKIRLKEIERILLALSMFDIESELYEMAFNEIHENRRLKEFVQYPRCLPSTLHYLSLRDMYSFELMDKILNLDYITETFGKNPKMLPHNIFSLDCCIEIDCLDYTGNRLTPTMRYKAAKWLNEYTPDYNQWKKLNTSDKFYLDVVDNVKEIVKDDSCIYIDHVLPHFVRADIILCKNKTTKEFIQPFGFQNYFFGDIKRPFFDDNLIWFAIVILGWNATIRNTSLPLGAMLQKRRQLKKIGYNPVFVIWNEFMILNKEDKINYILTKIS